MYVWSMVMGTRMVNWGWDGHGLVYGYLGLNILIVRWMRWGLGVCVEVLIAIFEWCWGLERQSLDDT